MLRFVIRSTALLLAIATVLVIVGIFDATLGWDIFGPVLESVLVGVFCTCLVLATTGIALSLVLGLEELVDLMRAGHDGRRLDPPRAMSTYLRWAGLGTVALAMLIVVLSAINHRIQLHRHGVFKEIAHERALEAADRIARDSSAIRERRIALALRDAMLLLQDDPAIRSAAVLAADPADPDIVWRYAPKNWHQPEKHRFERSFAGRDRERVALEGFRGDRSAIDAFNSRDGFDWIEFVRPPEGPPYVLVLRGNPSQNFRVYSGGS